eukprot:UN31044
MYSFDLICNQTMNQKLFFNSCGIIPLLQSAFIGCSSVVFAYGQTGSGKTHTMSGPRHVHTHKTIGEDTGLIQRSSEYIFHTAKQQNFTVKAGYIEIYNETTRDLINPAITNLKVKGDQENGFYVSNQLIVECNDRDDLSAVIIEGNQNRQIAGHRLNRDSSRSHCIFNIIVEGTVDGVHKIGKLNFVDLAGSERLKDSGSRNVKETANINRSLFVLGKVISTLSQNECKGTKDHIPYRDSLLTKLLSHCLGGDAMALMIATVNPLRRHVDESLNTLNYARRAMNIKRTVPKKLKLRKTR